MAENTNGVPQETISIEDMNVTPGEALPGTHEQLSFDLGSEYNLAGATLKLGTVSPLVVDGQYQEGDRIKVLLEVEVEYVSFPPIKDRGFRVGTERRHHGVVIAAAPAD